jgi:hypothetical protein
LRHGEQLAAADGMLERKNGLSVRTKLQTPPQPNTDNSLTALKNR